MNYLYGALIMIAMDYLWISTVMKKYYTSALPGLLRMDGGVISPRMLPAIIVYLMLYFAVIYFIDYTSGWKIVLIKSFLLGLCLYGVYDFTALALFKDWTWPLALIDVIWGCVLCSVTALVIYFTGNY